MRKSLLLVLALGVGIGASAQKQAKISNELLKQQMEGTYQQYDGSEELKNISYREVSLPALRATTEYPIGKTVYDIQSNSGITNRLYHAPDGKKAAVWTMGFTEGSFPDRGTGYNYFDGSAWQEEPTERIEKVRTGWPSYAKYKNGEVVVAHGGELTMSKREVQGSGEWEYSALPAVQGAELNWPRVITSGANNEVIHVIVNTNKPYAGTGGTLLYYRSTDGGDTWVDAGILLPGMSAEDGCGVISGDQYYMAASGDKVAILVAGKFSADLFLVKSEDNGATWNRTVIWESPIKTNDFGPALFDSTFVPDGSASIDLDDNGTAHIAFAITRVIKKEAGTSYSYWLYDGIIYWKEGDDSFTAPDQKYALNPDLLDARGCLVGFMPDIDGDGQLSLASGQLLVYGQAIGLSNFPAISCVQGSDDILLLWCSPNELADNGTHKFRHIFSRSFVGGKWSDEIKHVTDGEESMFSECIWPQIFKVYSAHEKAYILYNSDEGIGIAVTVNPPGDHPYNDNFMQFMEIDKEDLGLIVSTGDLDTYNFSVNQNYPNPFSGVTTIAVSLEQKANVKIQVLNLIGQEVLSLNRVGLYAGTHQIDLVFNSLETGVYFYTVTVGEKSITKKMVVK